MIREFIGLGGYTRAAEGFLSWQHLLFVSILNAAMVAFAFGFGIHMRGKTERQKNRMLGAAAIVMNTVEILKIILSCISCGDPLAWMNMLPLFLCSVQLIAVPLAAFSKGRLREAALDFVCIFGLLGAILGTYCAGNNYASYPVLSLDNVASGVTHTIAGFASLYIMISGMASLKKENRLVTVAILLSFCTAAYLANQWIPANYMFLMQGDGTPYDILYNLVNGHPVLYPFGVVALFLVYISLYYRIHALVRGVRSKEHAAQMV